MKKLIAIANVLIFGAMLFLNYLGATGAINGVSTGEVSGMYPTLFTPAGFTFAIWSIIYLLNLSFIIHQFYKAFRLPENFDMKLNQGFFFLTLTNAVWIIAWHRLAIGYSLFLMFILLIFLLGTYWQARRPKYTSEYITEYINFSVYLGWISVATIANVAIFLTTIGVNYQGPVAAVLTVVMIAIAVSFALFFIFSQGNVWYALIILWASYGIYAARNAAIVVGNDIPEGTEWVKIAALSSVIIVFASLVYFRIQRARSKA